MILPYLLGPVKGHASTGSPRQLARKPGVARRPGSGACPHR
ncbi:MAG: hypothetical protein ACP5ID_04715 [Conexivisphaera sp.]